MAYGKYKDLTKRIESVQVLIKKAFKMPNNPKYDGYQRGLAWMVYKLFDKKIYRQWYKIYVKSTTYRWTSEPVIRKFQKRRVYYSFKANIWGADSVDMQLISKYYEGLLLCGIDLFSKYTWVVPLKDKKLQFQSYCISKYFRQCKKKTKQNMSGSR